MELKKNIIAGKIKVNKNCLIIYLITFFFINVFTSFASENFYTEIKVLDKISSKNILIKLRNNEEKKFKDLLIKSIKCKNSEFDDNPEITAYIQVKDLSKKDNNEVFVFNGWMFSSSPSINPFDHPVYDIWLTKCY
jgi:hypothetical protein